MKKSILKKCHSWTSDARSWCNDKETLSALWLELSICWSNSHMPGDFRRHDAYNVIIYPHAIRHIMSETNDVVGVAPCSPIKWSWRLWILSILRADMGESSNHVSNHRGGRNNWRNTIRYFINTYTNSCSVYLWCRYHSGFPFRSHYMENENKSDNEIDREGERKSRSKLIDSCSYLISMRIVFQLITILILVSLRDEIRFWCLIYIP